MLDDGKTQSRSAHVAAASLVHAVKALEQARDMLLRDADAGILDVEQHLILHMLHLDKHLAAFQRVLDGVVDQVDEQLLDVVVVGDDEGILALVHVQFDVLVLGALVEHQADIARALAQAQTLGGNADAAVFHRGQGQNVVDQAGETIGFHGNNVQEALGHLRVFNRAGLKGFDEAADRGQRRFQLMGDVGGKVRAHLLQIAQLGDVLQQRDRADGFVLMLQRRDVQADEPVPRCGAHGQLKRKELFVLHGLLQARFQAGVAGGFEHVLALDVASHA